MSVIWNIASWIKLLPISWKSQFQSLNFFQFHCLHKFPWFSVSIQFYFHHIQQVRWRLVFMSSQISLACHPLLALPCVGSHKRTLLKIFNSAALPYKSNSMLFDDVCNWAKVHIQLLIGQTISTSDIQSQSLTMWVWASFNLLSTFDLKVCTKLQYNRREVTIAWKRLIFLLAIP